MRRNRNPFASRRPKKIRTRIRVRERVATAKTKGKCTACKLRFTLGQKYTVEIVKTRKFHPECVPMNIGVMGGNAIEVNATPEAVVKALTTKWKVAEAKMVGMLALENALVVLASNGTITPEMERAFEKYNKLKAMAMRPGSDNEGAMAARLAIIELVKAIF